MDPEGTDLPTDEAAFAEAAAVMAELRRDFPGEFSVGSVLDVLEDGRRVFALPFESDFHPKPYLN